MTRKHDAALVSAVSSSAVTRFFAGEAPKGTAAPYAVYWPMPGNDSISRESGPYQTQHPRWTVHCVGSTVEQAQWMNEQIKNALIPRGFGLVPTIAGENPSAFWYSNPIPADRDDDSTPSLFWVTAETGFDSDLL